MEDDLIEKMYDAYLSAESPRQSIIWYDPQSGNIHCNVKPKKEWAHLPRCLFTRATTLEYSEDLLKDTFRPIAKSFLRYWE